MIKLIVVVLLEIKNRSMTQNICRNITVSRFYFLPCFHEFVLDLMIETTIFSKYDYYVKLYDLT